MNRKRPTPAWRAGPPPRGGGRPTDIHSTGVFPAGPGGRPPGAGRGDDDSELLGRHGQRFRDLCALQDPKVRRERGEFAAEGEHAASALLHSTIEVRSLVVDVARAAHFPNLIKKARARRVPVFMARSQDFARLADSVHPSGILAVGALPARPALDVVAALLRERGLGVALDRLADPSNVGAVARTLEFFGGRHMLVSGSSADPFSARAIRASQGALFSLSIADRVELPPLLERVRAGGGVVIGTIPEGGVPLSKFKCPRGPKLLLFGNEARGLAPEAKDRADVSVTIEKTGETASLNVGAAAAILLYTLSRS